MNIELCRKDIEHDDLAPTCLEKTRSQTTITLHHPPATLYIDNHRSGSSRPPSIQISTTLVAPSYSFSLLRATK